jgi:hypothetical protein
MPQKPAVWMRIEILSVARGVLRRRSSVRIIAISSTRGDVKTLLREYRNYLAETRRLLEVSGIPSRRRRLKCCVTNGPTPWPSTAAVEWPDRAGWFTEKIMWLSTTCGTLPEFLRYDTYQRPLHFVRWLAICGK